MCVVSMVFDYGRRAYGPNINPPSQPFAPWVAAPPSWPTQAEWEAFLELVEKARKYDELAGLADCEDPTKAAWVADIERRLAELEGTPE